jgi:hypothetical protein
LCANCKTPFEFLLWCHQKDACSVARARIADYSLLAQMFLLPTAPNSERSELAEQCDHASTLSAACADTQDTAQKEEWLHEMTDFVNALLADGLRVRTKRLLHKKRFRILSVSGASLLVRGVKASSACAVPLQDVDAVTRDGLKVTIEVAKAKLLSGQHKTFECDSETTAVLLHCALNAFKGGEAACFK